MYTIDFSHPIAVHFIGIGGISMSGLAQILAQRGFKVSGSDAKQSAITDALEADHILIHYGHHTTNIHNQIDLVVYTAAIHEDNQELMEAKRLQIPCISRADLLGQIMKNYPIPVAVSGTHGKTTTTSMVSEILLQAKKDPTLSVGGMLKSIDGNIRIGKSDYFVTEACEYTNSFLSFFPKISIILNIEEDHMDFFNNLDEIYDSFHKFAKLLPSDGILIINNSIKDLSRITKDLTCKVITFGFTEDCDYYASDIHFDAFARPTFALHHKTAQFPITLGVTGEHNVLNALSTIALSDELGLSHDIVSSALLGYSGTGRRFEYKGTLGGITILDDYAHHPTEIRATLEAAKNYPHNRICLVFQPHTYTRTKAFLKDFATALSAADLVVLTDIYAAREKNTIGISSSDLLKELSALGTDSYYFPSFDEIENFLLENCVNGDLLITMGAGDVVNIGEKLLGQ